MEWDNLSVIEEEGRTSRNTIHSEEEPALQHGGYGTSYLPKRNATS